MLVIEDDEWVCRLLVNAIRDAGYGVLACATAKEGFETACAEEPSAIVCDVELPDGDGFWVARSIRSEASPVAATPFIFLTGLDDPASRMEGYQVGADVYITKPFRIQEVVAQIDALVQMAERMRRQMEMQGRIPALSSADADESDDAAPVSEAMSIPPPKANSPVTAIEGDLSQMSVATVLTVLEMERRTGMFEVVSKKRRAQLEIVGGAVVEGKIGGTRVKAVTTLRTMLGWKVGRFSFTPMPERDPPADRKSISAFLLEATRLEDEAMRDELDLPPSKRSSALGSKLPAPALGGQSSADDLLGPMSSRNSIGTPVPSSTMPIARPPANLRDDIFGETTGAKTVPMRTSAKRISEVPPEPATGVQTTLELDEIEPISAAPTGTSGVGSGGSRPVFPGLSGIGSASRPHPQHPSQAPHQHQHQHQKPAVAAKPVPAPPKPPLPPPRETTGIVPRPPGAAGTPPSSPSASAPPPLPKRDFVPPRPPPPPTRTTPTRPPPPLPLPKPDPNKKR